MVALSCPHCGNADKIIKFGTNRSGTTRCRCQACKKTFTPSPQSRALTPEKEAAIEHEGTKRVESQPLARGPAARDDIIEMDEPCAESPSLWLWVAASRQTRQVLGFAFGPRDLDMLALCWSDVGSDYKDKSVTTDGSETYRCFFSHKQHRACEKGSGETSIIESLNTKWW